MTGVMPPDHGMFDNLQFCYQMDFSSNLLSGAIPSNLGELTGLEIFNISHNHLSREIPSEFFNMDRLTIYDFLITTSQGQSQLVAFSKMHQLMLLSETMACGEMQGERLHVMPGPPKASLGRPFREATRKYKFF